MHTIDTDVQVYFCDPKTPWQRGTNEHATGLRRLSGMLIANREISDGLPAVSQGWYIPGTPHSPGP